jgi:hypothetical protein
MAHWWGDARLDKTHGLQMKGMMTPHEAPLMSQWWVFCGFNPQRCWLTATVPGR